MKKLNQSIETLEARYRAALKLIELAQNRCNELNQAIYKTTDPITRMITETERAAVQSIQYRAAAEYREISRTLVAARRDQRWAFEVKTVAV